MRILARRLVLILATLAFAAGLPRALAVPPTMAAEPCPQEHHAMMPGDDDHQHQAPQKDPHRHDAAECLCCCAGTCFAAPVLARAVAIAVPATTVAVLYPETAGALAGRTLRPDPAPPRTGTPS